MNRLSDVPTPNPGFLGKRGRVLGEAQDGLHVVRLAEYTFPDGSAVPYAELHETHDGQYPGRVMAISVLVHLAQNVGDPEIWEINNRQGPPKGPLASSEGRPSAADIVTMLRNRAEMSPGQGAYALRAAADEIERMNKALASKAADKKRSRSSRRRA